MTTEAKRNGYLTRSDIMNLLSEDEVARVSTSDGDSALKVGDEYVDLKRPQEGVVRMQVSSKIVVGEVLPRSAVGRATWAKIRGQISASRR